MTRPHIHLSFRTLRDPQLRSLRHDETDEPTELRVTVSGGTQRERSALALLVSAACDLQASERWNSFDADPVIFWDAYTDSATLVLENYHRFQMPTARRALAAIIRRARAMRRQAWP